MASNYGSSSSALLESMPSPPPLPPSPQPSTTTTTTTTSDDSPDHLPHTDVMTTKTTEHIALDQATDDELPTAETFNEETLDPDHQVEIHNEEVEQPQPTQPAIVVDVRSDDAPASEASPPLVAIPPPTAATGRTYLRRVLLTSVRAKLLTNPIALAVIVCIPFFLYGCDVGFDNAKEEIKNDLDITTSQVDFFVEFMTRGPGIVGALFAAVMANVIGRKQVALIGGGAYVIGVVVVFFSNEYAVSMVGHTLTGFSIGSGLVIGPVYIAEVAPAKKRGFLATFPQVLVVLGWAYSWVLSDFSGWRVKLFITTVPSLISTLMLACLPDTPCGIVIMSGKLEEANDFMSKCGAPEGERLARLAELQVVAKIPVHLVTNEEGINAPYRRKRITWYLEDPDTVIGFTRSLLITAGLFVAHELAYEEKLMHNVILIFSEYGHAYQASRVAIPVLVFIKLIGALVPVFTANVLGRRRALLLVSIGATSFFLAALGGMMLANFRAQVMSHVVAFPLYFLVFIGVEVSPTIGLGAIPWLYGPEVFPLLVRTPFFGLCVAVKLGIRGLFIVRLPLLTNLDTIGFGYLLLGGILTIGFILCWVFFRDDRTGEILVDDTVAHRLWSALAIVDRPHRPHQNVYG